MLTADVALVGTVLPPVVKHAATVELPLSCRENRAFRLLSSGNPLKSLGSSADWIFTSVKSDQNTGAQKSVPT